MRRCTDCGLESSDLRLFEKDERAKYGRRNKCRACGSRRSAAHIKARRQRWREIVREIKAQPCVDCGQSYPPYVMDFDHRGDKEFEIGKAVSQASISWARIQAEIAKCDVVCANCHRERSYQQGHLGPG